MTTRLRLPIVVTLAVLVLGAGIVAWSLTRPNAPAAAAPPGSQPIPARPIPEAPPPTVPASGACAAAMASIRAIQAEFPSGAMLTEAANVLLTKRLGTLDHACNEELAGQFRGQEVTPWLTYLPPPGS